MARVSSGWRVVILKPKPVLHSDSLHDAPMKPAEARVWSVGRLEALKLAETTSISCEALFITRMRCSSFFFVHVFVCVKLLWL